jgi:hypothetical protein
LGRDDARGFPEESSLNWEADMRRSIFAFALAIACVGIRSSVAGAQSHQLKVVTADGRPIAYAYVTSDRTPPLIADERGEVVLTAKGNKALKVTVRRIGFEPWSGVVEPGEPSTLVTLTVSPRAPDIAGVLPTDTSMAAVHQRLFYARWLQEQRGSVIGTFIGPEEILARHPKHVTDLLDGVSGITLVRSRLGSPVPLGSLGRCEMKILVDGQQRCPTDDRHVGLCTADDWVVGRAPTQGGGGGGGGGFGGGRGGRGGRGGNPDSQGGSTDSTAVLIDEELHVSDIAAIEIYALGEQMPAGVYDRGLPGCGVIGIWTRRWEP